MATITKKDLIDRIAQTTGQRRVVVKRTVQSFLEQVMLELGRSNRLEFRDFGVFEIKQRAPRVAQNPKTLQRVEVPAKRTVKFKVGRLMKQCLDDPARCHEFILSAAEADEDDGSHAEVAAPAPRLNGVLPRAHNGSSKLG
ncbi:MAG TPA: HU family DNA-binding protein [Phycisphaerales bacterium]|nr:HU family DNA-binding protein [Phycisphaerales bacterium]